MIEGVGTLSTKQLEAVGLVFVSADDVSHPHDLDVEGSVKVVVLVGLDAPVDKVEPLVVSVEGL